MPAPTHGEVVSPKPAGGTGASKSPSSRSRRLGDLPYGFADVVPVGVELSVRGGKKLRRSLTR